MLFYYIYIFICRILDSIEMVCSKCYHASGIITITILFDYTVYVCILDGSNENPLLDSRFPDISGKGRGYQIQSYDNGLDGWSQLRKISIWQTVASLEQVNIYIYIFNLLIYKII